jgi:hypothetical protein
MSKKSRGGFGGVRRREEEWEKPGGETEEKTKDSMRESVFEGDVSSEYLRNGDLEMRTEEGRLGGTTSRYRGAITEWLAETGLPRFLYYLNPWNYGRIDWIFASCFAFVVGAAFLIFWTSSVVVALASLVVMFLSFSAMLMCVGVESILKEGYHKITGRGERISEEAFDNDAFEK